MTLANSDSSAPLAGTVNIDSWQKGQRGSGLANMHRIIPNLLVVNAQDTFPLNDQAKDYDLHEIPAIARVMDHPAVSGFVVTTKDGDVLLEPSNVVRELVAGKNFMFNDRGETERRGFEDPVRLFEVRWSE
jgi:hypothetical protein